MTLWDPTVLATPALTAAAARLRLPNLTFWDRTATAVLRSLDAAAILTFKRTITMAPTAHAALPRTS